MGIKTRFKERNGPLNVDSERLNEWAALGAHELPQEALKKRVGESLSGMLCEEPTCQRHSLMSWIQACLWQILNYYLLSLGRETQFL